MALVTVEGVAQPPNLPEHPPPGPHPRLRLQYELAQAELRVPTIILKFWD